MQQVVSKMRPQTVGVLYMMVNSVQNSLVGIFFKLSLFEAAPVVFMIGLWGSSIAVTLLAANPYFKNFSLNKVTYLKAALNGCVLGGGSNFGKYFAMDFINASESLVILFFVCTFTAVLAETFSQGLRPTAYSIVSIVLGLLGTVFICEPQTLFTSGKPQYRIVTGIFIAALSGVSAAFFFGNVKRFSELGISNVWSFLWFMAGCSFFASITYNPFISHWIATPDCDFMSRIWASLSIFCQIIASLTAVMGFSRMIPSAAFVFQLQSSVITFILQSILFPESITWNSTLGSALVVSAVALQGISVLRKKPLSSKALTS